MQYKLAILIPCFNEENTLPATVAELPRQLDQVATIEVIVVDDGSTDQTSRVAKSLGCHVVRHKFNKGLGQAFRTGTNEALRRGCDLLVNTDADGQYPARFIKGLIEPVINGDADMVVGNRIPWKIKEFSKIKRVLQYIGNTISRKLIGVNVPDTVSGFRAYSRELLISLNITTKFSYVLDTLVQAEFKGYKIETIRIDTNPATRPSRLFKNIFHHVTFSGMNLIRVLLIYRPFHLFSFTAALIGLPGIFLIIRFLFFYMSGNGSGHLQSLIITSILIFIALLMIVLGVISFLVGINRSILEQILKYKKEDFYG